MATRLELAEARLEKLRAENEKKPKPKRGTGVRCDCCKLKFANADVLHKHTLTLNGSCMTVSTMYSRGWAFRNGIWVDYIPELPLHAQTTKLERLRGIREDCKSDVYRQIDENP